MRIMFGSSDAKQETKTSFRFGQIQCISFLSYMYMSLFRFCNVYVVIVCLLKSKY